MTTTGFTLYTKDNCPHCVAAKRLLQQKNQTYTELKVPDQADRETIQERVLEAGSSAVIRSVPQIFHGEKYIGGGQQLKRYLETL